MNKANSGMRIKFHKKDHLMVSVKIYSNGDKLARLIVDTENMMFKIVDPVTGYIHDSGGEGITNLEVLQRKAKKALKNCLGLYFEKEVRNVGQSE